jgi:N-acyl-D-amino-acid deacylase
MDRQEGLAVYDYLFRGATIIDGTGRVRFLGDVAVKNGKLHIDSAVSGAREVIDAGGCVLSPGFIDAHSHGDRVLGTDYGRLCKTSQGITTEVAGQCGSTCFPVAIGKSDLLSSYLGPMPDWVMRNMDSFTSLSGFLRSACERPLTANFMLLTGHTALRIAVMGYDNRQATDAELEAMKRLLRESMEQGSLGLSSGLLYAPASYADMREMVSLCEVVGESGGVYATHMRDESRNVVESVAESIEVARRSGARLQISHHKIGGRANWGMSERTLALIEEANENGVQVTFDAYPYTASMTRLSACLPAYCFERGIDAMREMLKKAEDRARIRAEICDPDSDQEGRYRNCGGFKGIVVARAPETPEAEGLSVEDYAAGEGVEAFDAYFDLLIANGNAAFGIYSMMCDEDLLRIVRNRYCAIGSDGLVTSMHGKTHPRGWGTFPRAIRLFTRETDALPLEELIRKMTSLPAEIYSLPNRGRIAENYEADLVLFDPGTIGDCADYADPTKPCEGIRMVMTNGRIVYRDGTLTGENSGRFIPRSAR